MDGNNKIPGGDGTGFDPYFLADFSLANPLLLHEEEDNLLIEGRDLPGPLPEAELLAHPQAPALPPEPEAAPALLPEPEAAPALPPGPEAGGPGLSPGPEEDPVLHAIATKFNHDRGLRLITSKVLTPSDIDTTRNRLLLPTDGDLHLLEYATGQVLAVYNLEGREFSISLRGHRRERNTTKTGLAFTRGWSDFVQVNGLQAGTSIQIWTFTVVNSIRRKFIVVSVRH